MIVPEELRKLYFARRWEDSKGQLRQMYQVLEGIRPRHPGFVDILQGMLEQEYQQHQNYYNTISALKEWCRDQGWFPGWGKKYFSFDQESKKGEPQRELFRKVVDQTQLLKGLPWEPQS